MEKVVNKKPLWQKCSLCHDTNFTKLDQFERHLYDKHRTVSKNNSYYCKYGSNGVCNGHNSRSYSESEYKTHIVQDHAFHIISVLPYHKTSNCKKPSDEWNFYSASQSLSTVLNDPKQPRSKDFFTKIWGDKFTDLNPVPPSQHLPIVKLQNFQDYLKRISKKHKKHIELSKEEKKEEYPAEIRQQFPNLRLSKLTDGVSYNLSEVPLVFLESNFDLSNCETFFTVFPNIFPTLDYLTNIPMANIKLSHKSIQEKLIYYLDTVEVKIAQQVRSKSEAFFHIMTSHDALNEKISQSIQLAGQSRGQGYDNQNMKGQNQGVQARLLIINP
ncbi:vacuolar protein sorting-associated protein 54-like isoform X1 [Daktulosphaira vitifoliae]|uniref:vacuolar protein sorting-associated protein 54-like isoform X1 n=1 Tax=Daktulosphaira vitifoliae TaxID=58002 RepID=UPI0021AA69D8|nr:vacuolar protein sorting-associated protein 54-like isoform X1 [Daktulosphaira vitifoliae]